MSGKKRVVVVGGTGFLGSHLTRQLVVIGYDVVVATRGDAALAQSKLDTLYTPGAVTAVQWDPNLPANTQRDEAIANALDGCAAVFQFAGEPVFRSMLPVTRSQLDAAMFGRTHIVRRLGKIIRDLPNKPGVFVNASSIGYYGFPSKRSDEEVTEATEPHEDYWHKHKLDAEEATTDLETECRPMRTVNLRIGSVLCAKEGFIRLFSSMYQRGVSAVFGDGKSWICWIHIEDVVAMCIRVIQDTNYTGPLNMCIPATFQEWAEAFSKVLGIPLAQWWWIPEWLIKVMMPNTSVAALRARRCVPAKARALGYIFMHEELEDALKDVLKDEIKELEEQRRANGGKNLAFWRLSNPWAIGAAGIGAAGAYWAWKKWRASQTEETEKLYIGDLVEAGLNRLLGPPRTR